MHGGAGDPVAALVAGPPVPVSQIWQLERSGVSPDDTTVTVAARTGRTVLIRHRAPDNSIFAVLRFPADSTSSDSLTFTIRPVPGLYGLDLSTGSRIPAGTTVTFSYAVHFQAPSEAAAAYGSAARFEQALAVGRLEGDRFRYLSNTRPAADMLSSVVTAAGRYLIAGPVRR